MMTGSNTVLFTSQNTELFFELQRLRPDIALLAIGSTVPPLESDGNIWCFVDFLLPHVSGLEMCRRLRSEPATHKSSITMVFEQADKELIMRALHAGADDYLVGQVSVEEILLRIDKLPLSSTSQGEKIVVGDIVVEPSAHRVKYTGKRIDLAPNEFHLLLHFVRSPDIVFSREDLIQSMGKVGDEIESRTVDVWIGRLRRAFKKAGAPELIRTVRPIGYVFEAP